VPGEDGRSLDDIEEEARKREAGARAVVLEMIGDLPEADAKPPADMLFVCKLNPVTTEEARRASSVLVIGKRAARIWCARHLVVRVHV